MAFPTIFTKMNNCDFLDNLALSKWGPQLKDRICSCGSKFFPLRVDSYDKGGKNEIGRFASPESVPIQFNINIP